MLIGLRVSRNRNYFSLSFETDSHPGLCGFTDHVSSAVSSSLGFDNNSARLLMYTPRSFVLAVIETPAPIIHSLAMVIPPSLIVEFAPIKQYGSIVVEPKITELGLIKQ